MNNHRVSVIIPTRDRPKQLQVCIYSILQNSLLPDEILIAYYARKPQLAVRSTKTKIVFLQIKSKGIARANNEAISRATGDILLFTSDDCAVSKKWVATAFKALVTPKSPMLIFGQVIPKQKHRYCPSIQLSSQNHIITPKTFDPKSPNEYFVTSNFACRKTLFYKIGLFLPWLGIGSSGISSEDNEFCLRLVTHHIPYAYVSQLVVYHNRSLNRSHYELLLLRYLRGWIAMWIYYYAWCPDFRSNTRSILLRVLKDGYNRMVLALHWKTINKERFINFSVSIEIFKQFLFGLILGGFYGVIKYYEDKERSAIHKKGSVTKNHSYVFCGTR